MRGTPCPKCNASSNAGDRFCNQCGGPLPASGAKAGLLGGMNPAWAVAGALLLALVVAIATRDNGGREITMTPPPQGGAVTGSPPDLSSMTPREAADRLFRRVMDAIAVGDQAQADQFLPMAIGAYARIQPLNLDDRFHLSLLHAAAGDGTTAAEIAEEGLTEHPTHLLVLAAAAEAAVLLGQDEVAIQRYEQLVDAYEAELAGGLPEYSSHGPELLPNLRDEANAYLSGASN